MGQRFLQYLQLLQPVGDGEGPEIQIEFEVEVDESELEDDAPGAVHPLGSAGLAETDPRATTDEDRHEPVEGRVPLGM